VSGVPPVGSVVDGDALLQVLWVSLVAGIGVTASYAAAILGATRAIDLSRSGRTGEAAIFGLLAIVAVAVVAGAVVFGIIVMTHK
jgi:ABC-type spermidine/putrescine transport system permease subunit II